MSYGSRHVEKAVLHAIAVGQTVGTHAADRDHAYTCLFVDLRTFEQVTALLTDILCKTSSKQHGNGIS